MQAAVQPRAAVWSARDAGASGVSLAGIVWSGTRFVAVGGSTIVSSPDGVAWTKASSPALTKWAGNLMAVASSGKGLVAVGSAGDTFSSPDGDTWTGPTRAITGDPSGFYLTAVAWTGVRYDAVGPNGAILRSPEGLP